MILRLFIFGLLVTVFPASLFGEAVGVQSPLGVTVQVDKDSGTYEIAYQPTGWKFEGNSGLAFSNITTNRGVDKIGTYTKISWSAGASLTKSICIYEKQPAALFTIANSQAAEKVTVDFPDFTNFPALHHFSYHEAQFAPARFDLEDNGTPWLLFDDAAKAIIISPADNFLIASMHGDGTNEISSGLNSSVHDLPANFSQSTLVVFGNGIQAAWKTWSDVFLAKQGAPRPDNDADTGLRYLGYWTDNGAYYYYNYDTNAGYAKTLEKLVRHYRSADIPIRYLQLDSWWYYKTLTGLDGKTGKGKNLRLPEGEWNRYGGLLEYRAHPAVLPEGLDGFQKDINLPLVTHNRWIDPASPYHDKYQVSGIAGVDLNYWEDILSYIGTNGVACYEQDWLNEIYAHSPDLQSQPGVADVFADNMAHAAQENHLSLQYCMALPRFFLQGSRYPNLTTIRASEDHFQPNRWDNFLFTSQLARAVGIWPWTDVFRSTETNNLLISILSAGMVGVGDPMGHESRKNLLRAARADGVLVKPDESLLPLDQVYLAQANGNKKPMVAWTYSDHGGQRTAYVFAYIRDKQFSNAAFTPAGLGLQGEVCVLDVRTGHANFQSADESVTIVFDPDSTAYYEVAPVGKSGMAFFGDEGKYVSNGKQCIAALEDDNGTLTATIVFAPGEKSVRVFGFAKKPPTMAAESGSIGNVSFDQGTLDTSPGRFSMDVMPAPELDHSKKDPERKAVVTFREP